MKIKVLPESVYSKIAAGEVIDKPASIVRELIDNSIDAKATEIVISLKKGGIEEITVRDNGCGMDKEDLATSILKHSTSKIETTEDLNNIQTMGFRGEALYSVNTVSKLTITSSTDDSGQTPGYKICEENSFTAQAVACRKGTKIEIRDLFYNLPARKKFLKSATAELNAVKSIVYEKIFATLNISYSLYNDGKLLFRTNGDGDFENAFFAVYKLEDPFSINKFEYQSKSSPIKVTIYHSPADVFFQSRKYQTMFVNSRPITCPFFYSAISKGYSTYVSPNRHPLIFVFLETDPSLIDVNIHPAKREVKFFDQAAAFNTIMQGTMAAFSSKIRRELSLEPSDPFSDNDDDIYPFAKIELANVDPIGKNVDVIYPTAYSEKISTQRDYPDLDDIYYNFNESNKPYSPFGKELPKESGSLFAKYEALKVQPTPELPHIKQKETFKDFKILSVAFDTYIIVEKNDKLYFVDQHAVEEAYIYMKKKEAYAQNPDSERLMIPVLFEIEKLPKNLNEKLEQLNSCGFCIEENEGSTYSISEIPCVLKNMSTGQLTQTLSSFLQDDADDERTIIDKILITASCRQAVKKGDRLTAIQIEEIITRFFKYNIMNCPHGRPVYFEIPRMTFERNFQRRR
jgi:DNA mismatch repair protein MutL